MSHVQSLQPGPSRGGLSAAVPTRVIEVGDVTAGIAVPERGGVRFFSSQRAFDSLEGTLFRSVVQATRAARGHARRPV